MKEWWIVAPIIFLKVSLVSWNSPFGPRAKRWHVAYILYPSQFRIRIFCSRFLFLRVPRNTRKSRKSGDSRLLIPSLLSRSVVGIDSQKKLFTFFFLCCLVVLFCWSNGFQAYHSLTTKLPLLCGQFLVYHVWEKLSQSSKCQESAVKSERCHWFQRQWPSDVKKNWESIL